MKTNIRDLTLIPLFTVLIIIGGKITIPTILIPVTLQYVMCLLTGILLGARRAMMAVGLYLLIGLLGVPVFAAGGGLAYVLQPSFGYLAGMLLCAGLVGFFADRLDPLRDKLKTWQLIPVNFLGQLVVYLFGVGYLYLIKNFYAGQEKTFLWAIEVGMIPFLITDSAFSVFAALISPRLRRLTSRYIPNRQPSQPQA